MKVDLSEQEIQVIVNSLDGTVRAQGLQAAGACLQIAAKLQAAVQEAARNVASDPVSGD